MLGSVKRSLVIAFVLFVVAGCSGPAAPRATGVPQKTTSPTPSPTPARFEAAIQAIPPDVAAQMTGVSWKPGCPVPLDQLRLITLNHHDFDGVVRNGEIVMHADVAAATVRIFGKLFEARFPIRKMQRVEPYGADDNASMADDNTSGFNCRRIENSTRWSRHAYGKAIDINTVENPYLLGRRILPPAGSAYLDRSNVRPGMIVAGDVVTRAFAAEGFRWGGDYRTDKDYQHFDLPG
jgi:hypothetical protein